MKEHYVSYPQAVKLKELGFDWRCDHFWHKEFTDSDKMALRQASADDFNHDDWFVPHCSAPRLDQAQAWLREVKGIHITLNPYSINPDRYDGDNYFWSFELFHVPTGGWLKVNGGGFDTYDLALSAGIDKALELLTNEHPNK